jgi:hypothetical protein
MVSYINTVPHCRISKTETKKKKKEITETVEDNVAMGQIFAPVFRRYWLHITLRTPV